MVKNSQVSADGKKAGILIPFCTSAGVLKLQGVLELLPESWEFSFDPNKIVLIHRVLRKSALPQPRSRLM